VLVRVEHIDGTLEPPVSVQSGFDANVGVGAMLGLDDGRLGIVIGHERDANGAITSVIVGEGVEKRIYSATGHEAYVSGPDQLRMGGSYWGTLVVDGTPLVSGPGVTVGSPDVDADSPAWSPDGRYLAAMALRRPVTREELSKIIVIDAESREVIGIVDVDGRLPLWFVARSVFYFTDDGVSNLRF
jgi:hypothetical protein